MSRSPWVLVAVSLLSLGACSGGGSDPNVGSGGGTGTGGETGGGAGSGGGEEVELTVSYDFSDGAQGWEAGFSDYSPVHGDMELDEGIVSLPSELGSGQGFVLQSHNRSDDVFMFLKRSLARADGIQPGQAYTLAFEIVFASSAQEGCFGIGGAPAESVYLKVGGSPTEPEVLLEEDEYRLSVDKGNQAQGGLAASVAGHIGNGDECGQDELYRSVTLAHTHEEPVTATADGQLWLLVGTDSGFEGLTRLYYQNITVRLSPVE